MKIYAVRDGVMCAGEVEDGAMCMEIGARHGTEPPIEMIDWEAREFRRGLRSQRPFPAKWYRVDDVVWSPVDA